MSEEKKVFQSLHLMGGTYDPKTQTLRLTFVGGGAHVYTSVPPSVWHDLTHAGSPGSYHAQHIRGNPEYPSYPLHQKKA